MRGKQSTQKQQPINSMKNVRDILHHARDMYGNDIAYRQIESRGYETAITFRGLSDNTDALGTALLKLGLKDRHVAIIGETSIEWITAWLSVICGTGVIVPIDRELNPETIVKQVSFGDIDAVICSKSALRKIKEALPFCPNVKTLITMRTESTEGLEALCENVFRFEDLLAQGRMLLKKGDDSFKNAEIDENAFRQLIFTSGTTGANKGVMLTHMNLITALRGAKALVSYKKTSISVLPVNHTYELTCHIIACLYEDSTVCINDDLKHVMQNLEHFAPQMSCMVPMMLDLMVRKIKAESVKTGLDKHLNFGMKASRILRMMGIDKRKKFFQPILSKFGGNLELIICGGAPLSQETIDFMDAIGITVLNGYGISECAPLVACNSPGKGGKGSVGRVIPTCKVRISDKDENGNGEIQVQGGNVMLGYYKSPEDTAAVFTQDGWFRTGDIGHLDDKGYLYICGRLKNLIILSNGKNVYPEEVEDAMQAAIPYLKEVVTFADSANTGIYAVCHPDPEYCREKGLADADACKEHLMQDIRKYNQKVPSFKRITDIEISLKEFEKTSTKKIKRFEVAKSAQGQKTA